MKDLEKIFFLDIRRYPSQKIKKGEGSLNSFFNYQDIRYLRIKAFTNGKYLKRKVIKKISQHKKIKFFKNASKN